MSTAAVKVKVEIAQPFVIAGEPFSLTTSIENAHEDSIDIIEIGYHIPYQVQWIREADFNTAFEAEKSLPLYSRLFRSSLWRKAAQPHGQAMSYAALGSTPPTPVFTILPSESGSYSYKAIVSRWLFVTGGELNFPGRINYLYKGVNHSALFDIRLTLRPPLMANGIGAVVGSILGSIARNLKDNGIYNIEFFSGLALSSILAVIAVIYSSRRTGEAQPIMTVEDFWGGLFVGFMLGYLGSGYFQKIVPIS